MSAVPIAVWRSSQERPLLVFLWVSPSGEVEEEEGILSGSDGVKVLCDLEL